VASALPPKQPSTPSSELNRPPASTTTGTSAAMSYRASSGSVAMSTAPSATSMYDQKSPKARLRHTDLVSEHVDVAIRLGGVKDEQLVARRIGAIEQALFASPVYLDLRGRPIQPADLVEHECIFVRNPQRQALWQLQRDGESTQVAVRGRFMVNNLGLMRLLAERGMGIAALAPPLVREAVAQERLVQVLPQWGVPRLPIQAVMSSRLQPASVKALVDFLAARLALV